MYRADKESFDFNTNSCCNAIVYQNPLNYHREECIKYKFIFLKRRIIIAINILSELKTYPLCVEIFNCFCYCEQNSTSFSFWEKFLPKNFVQQFSSFHKFRYYIYVFSIIIHLQKVHKNLNFKIFILCCLHVKHTEIVQVCPQTIFFNFFPCISQPTHYPNVVHLQRWTQNLYKKAIMYQNNIEILAWKCLKIKKGQITGSFPHTVSLKQSKLDMWEIK